MRRIFTKTLSVVLAVVMLISVASPALAATYRNGAQSGPSSSYAGSRYYENYKRVPITGDNRTDLIAIALSQLGYQEGNSNGAFSGEVSGRYNYVEFSYNMGDLGLGYGGSDYPWCASFVSWCLYQSHCTDQNSYKDLGRNHIGDYDYIWKEISCSQWVRQLKGAGYYKYSAYEGGSYTPKYGDLVFFQNSNGVAHIGICLYVSGGRIYTVEGNTSDAAGLEPNGGGVYFKNYSLSTSYINGYGVLPYKTNSSVPKIDYSGANPTPGLYVANAAKYIYATETATSHSWVMSRFTMFEVTEVCSNGRLKVITKNSAGNTVTGYVNNNSDRVIQLSTTETNAVDTARANLQKVITQAEQIWFYDYTEAQILTIRSAYNSACTVLRDTSATEAELTAAAATLRNEMAKTGSNTIALNNQGVYINGKNSVIEAGDCFLYSPGWNNGLITVENANIRYTLNVVFQWDSERQINVVKSITEGTGSSTPDIQLSDTEWMIACHDWETGISAGDNPVEYSGTNYKILKSLSVGDGVKLSGCTALTHDTYVESAAYLKFIPAEAAIITGENERVGSGKTVLFTPDFNQGLLNHENANVHYTLNVIAQWDNEKSAWIVTDKFAGNGLTDESSNIEIEEGQVVIAAHVGDATSSNYSSTAYNWRMLNAAEVGQQVIFSGVSPTDGVANLSIAANVSFVDYVASDDEEEYVPSENLALNKDYFVKDPGTAAHIANLTDGTYTTALDFTGGWFGFACIGDNCNTDETGVGNVVIDLGSTYALESFRAHIYAGTDGAAASILPPLSVDVFLSNNGTDYVNVGQLSMDADATAPFWGELVNAGYAARYVKFEFAPSGNSTWVFLNELEVYGTALTGGENVGLTTDQIGTPVSGYEGDLTNGILSDWYGIDTTEGSGSVVIDLGSRFKVTKVLSFVAAGADITAPGKISVSVSADGTNYFKTGELGLNTSATEGYWAELTQDPTVGRYVKLEAESEAALVLLSEVAVAGTVYTQSDNVNIAMGKTTVVSGYTDSPFTALLNDGLASNVFQYNVNNSSWFAFKNTGDAATGNVNLDNGRGVVTIDLGGQAEITNVRIHLFAGANDAGATSPNLFNVYYSNDGQLFDYLGYMKLDTTATGAYWSQIVFDDDIVHPFSARYVKLGIGVDEGTMVLLNEVEVTGLMLTQDEANEPGSLSSVALSGDFNGWNATPNMTILDDNTVSGTLNLEAGTHEFKLLYSNEWYGNNGTIVNTTGDNGWVMDTAADNCKLQADQAGNYEFLFNLETKELKVAYLPETLYLRGSFNEWGTVNEMTYNGDGTYSVVMTMEAGTYEYKVADAEYTNAWPANNATLELGQKSEVLFTLNVYSGEVTASQVAVQHSYEAVVTAPTCDTAGYTTYTCTDCGDSYVADEVEALGHTWVDATCTTVKYCSVCDRLEGGALGHSWAEATCTEPKTCSTCGETEGEALGHSWVEATCTDPRTCSACDATESEALGHTWAEATCLVPRTCSVCGMTEGEVGEHDYESVVTAPKCLQDGYTTHTCTVCGEGYRDSYVYATGHSWVDATCTAPMTCSVCGITRGNELGHINASVVTAPTCTKGGYTTNTCTVCGESSISNEVPALGHTPVYSFSGSVHTVSCSVCGASSSVDGTAQFKINSAYLTLASDISVIYRCTVPAGFENAYVVFTSNGRQETAYSEGTDANGRHLFRFEGVDPHTMGDNISATLYATLGGMEVSNTVAEYSVLKYCTNQLGKSPTAAFKTLISDLLVYGAKAQIYVGYNTDALVTAGLEETLTPSTFPGVDKITNKQSVTGTATGNADVKSAALALSNKVYLKLGFTVSDDISLYTYRVTIGDEVFDYTSDSLTEGTDRYYLVFDEFGSNQFDETITVIVLKDGQQVSRTLEYSVNTYIKKNGDDTAFGQVLQAVYNYGVAAKAYAG